MKKLLLLLAGVSLLFATNTYARDWYDDDYDDFDTRFHHKQHRQQSRIEDGIYNGRLTPREIEKLRCEQEEIADLERRFLRDGWFSDREKRILQKKLNKANRRIYKYKHNRRVSHKVYHDDYDHYDDRRGYGYSRSGIRIGGADGGFYLSW
jgi:hypothetical protein